MIAKKLLVIGRPVFKWLSQNFLKQYPIITENNFFLNLITSLEEKQQEMASIAIDITFAEAFLFR